MDTQREVHQNSAAMTVILGSVEGPGRTLWVLTPLGREEIDKWVLGWAPRFGTLFRFSF